MSSFCKVHPSFPQSLICLTDERCFQVLCRACVEGHRQRHDGQAVKCESIDFLQTRSLEVLEAHRRRLEEES